MVFNASTATIKCKAWKVLSDERNCIAIGQGRPEIHRFEVRCFEQKLDKLSRYLEVRCYKSSQKIAFNSRFIGFFTFERCFDTCSKVIRIEKVTESYFLFANCVNVHLLSEFLRKYIGLIRRVTKSVTICHPLLLASPNASEPGIGCKWLKISTF